MLYFDLYDAARVLKTALKWFAYTALMLLGIAVLVSLSSCALKAPSVVNPQLVAMCPPMVDYTQDDRTALVAELEGFTKAGVTTKETVKFLSDYTTVRDEIRTCQKYSTSLGASK